MKEVATCWQRVGGRRSWSSSTNPGHSNQAPGNAVGAALFNHGSANALDDEERGIERPPPKNKAELFNPKAGSKRNAQPQQSPEQPSGRADTWEEVYMTCEQKPNKESTSGEVVASAILGSLYIQDQHFRSEIENIPKAGSLLCRLAQLHKPAIVGSGDGTRVGTDENRTTPD